MKVKKHFCFFVVSLVLIFSCSQQKEDKLTFKLSPKADSLLNSKESVDPTIDSLKNVVLNSKNDTVFINALNSLAGSWNLKPQFTLIDEALKLSRSIGYKYGEADALWRKGGTFVRSGAPDSTMKYLEYSESIAKQYNYTGIIELVYFWKGESLRAKGEAEKSIESHLNTIKQVKASGNKRVLGLCYTSLGEIHRQNNRYDEAIFYNTLAVEILEKFNEPRRLSMNLNSLAQSYMTKGDYNKALGYSLRSVGLIEPYKDPVQIGLAYAYLGQIYMGQENYSKAKENLVRAVALLENQTNKNYILFCVLTLGQVYTSEGNYEKAIGFYKKGFEIAKEVGDKRKQTECLGLLGQLATLTKKYDESLSIHKETLKLAEEIGDESMKDYCYNAIANVLVLQHKYSEAAQWGEKGIILAKQLDVPQKIKEASEVLFKAYALNNQFEKAFDMQSLFITMKDSTSNTEQVKKFAAIEYEAKENKLKGEQEKRNADYEKEQIKKEAEIKNQKMIRNGFIAGFVLLMALAFVIFRSLQANKRKNEIITEQKETLQDQKQEITDSINYAKRIQNAILPEKSEINKFIPNSFGLYKPKDIVSGDFYFFAAKNECCYMAVGDCTGHGVPGAFMSLVGSKELQIAVERADQPGEILSYLNKGVKQALKQNTAEATKDGMDIAICKIYKNKLVYSGANRPLWIIRNNSKVIEEYTATKTAIGGFTEDNYIFIEHAIELNAGDTFYLFTDGYADQFGGEKQKKMTTKRLKETLLSIQKLSMEDQKAELESYLDKWKGSLEQVDDVLVVGIRF